MEKEKKSKQTDPKAVFKQVKEEETEQVAIQK